MGMGIEWGRWVGVRGSIYVEGPGGGWFRAGAAAADMERREEEGEVAAAMVGTGDGRKVTRVRLVWTL